MSVDKIIVREALPQDMEAIRACHAEVEKVLGEAMDLPEVAITKDGKLISNPAILEYLVVEENGKVIGFHYQEKTLEMCHGGMSPKATLALANYHRENNIFYFAHKAGIRYAHCQVPKKLSGPVGRELKKSGFRNVSRKYKHYVLDLR